jgi:hypothetical protein
MTARLARLAALAAAGEGLDRVDAATVERAWRELLPEEVPVELRAADEPPATRPTVRAVRRLWG